MPPSGFEESSVNPLIDSALAAFMQSGVAMVIASRDANNVPAIVRGGGCRVAPDGERVTIFIAPEQAGRFLDDIRATGCIAAVMVETISTYECYQIKGILARIVALATEDHARIRSYRQAFFKNLTNIGLPPTLSAGMLPEPPDAFIGVEFTPTEIFRQTPGPGAGERRGA
jgi:hypothetical protein